MQALEAIERLAGSKMVRMLALHPLVVHICDARRVKTMMDDRDQSSTLLSGRVDDNGPLSQWYSHNSVMVVTAKVCVCCAFNVGVVCGQRIKRTNAMFREVMLRALSSQRSPLTISAGSR